MSRLKKLVDFKNWQRSFFKTAVIFFRGGLGACFRSLRSQRFGAGHAGQRLSRDQADD